MVVFLSRGNIRDSGGSRIQDLILPLCDTPSSIYLLIIYLHLRIFQTDDQHFNWLSINYFSFELYNICHFKHFRACYAEFVLFIVEDRMLTYRRIVAGNLLRQIGLIYRNISYALIPHVLTASMLIHIVHVKRKAVC